MEEVRLFTDGAGCPSVFFMGHLMALKTFRRINAIFAWLAFGFLVLFVGNAVVDAQEAARKTLGEVQVWAEMHQKRDDEQFRRIDTIEKRMSDNDLKLETRLTNLENNQKSVMSSLDSISWWMRTLALAVALQLLNMLWRLALKGKKVGKYELPID